MNSNALLSGEELCPIQAGEWQSSGAVFYSAAVNGQEPLAEDIQQSLQTIFSYGIQYNQQYHGKFYIPKNNVYDEEEMMERVPVVVMMYSESTFLTHLIHCGTLLHCLGVNACVRVTVN